jgi:hypothetical protein
VLLVVQAAFSREGPASVGLFRLRRSQALSLTCRVGFPAADLLIGEETGRAERPFATDEEEVEARCLVAYSMWIGNHFIAADHGGRSRADVLALALRRLEA